MIVCRTMWTQSSSVSDRRTDGRTDRRTDRITITKTVQRIASHGKKCKLLRSYFTIMGHGSPMTHVTHPKMVTHLTHDPSHTDPFLALYIKLHAQCVVISTRNYNSHNNSVNAIPQNLTRLRTIIASTFGSVSYRIVGRHRVWWCEMVFSRIQHRILDEIPQDQNLRG